MKRYNNQEGTGKVAVLGIIAVIAIVISAFVFYPAMNDPTKGKQTMGIAIIDAETGKTVSGEINIAPMTMAEQILSLGQKRTVTLPAMYTAAEMAAYSADINGAVLNRAYIIIPFVKMVPSSDSSVAYSATGKAWAEFTGNTKTGTSVTFQFAALNGAETMTSPKVDSHINAVSTINPIDSSSSVRFYYIHDQTDFPTPMLGAYLDMSVIHAKIMCEFTNLGKNVLERNTATADLTIHLVNPLSGVFSIEITAFGVGYVT